MQNLGATGYDDANLMGSPFNGNGIGVPFSGPSTSESWIGKDCASLIQDLSRSIAQIVDREARKKKQEMKQVEKDHEARKAGGFWSRITAGPLAEFQSAVEEAGGTARDISQGKQGLLDRYSQYLDLAQTYTGMSTDLVSGVISNLVDEAGVLHQVTDALGIDSLIPTGQDAGCTRSLLVGTAKSVVRIAGRAVNNAVQSVFNVQATLGMAFSVVPDLYAGLMSMPAGSLSVLLTNRETLLDRIESTVDAALDLAVKIKEDDYPFDHRSFVLAAQAALQEADGYLGQVENTLEAGGKFLEDLWDRSTKIVEDTAEDLLGVGAQALVPGFAHGKIVQLLGYQKLLETLYQILVQRQAAFEKLVSALGQFKSSFETNAQFQNLMAPLVQQVRCELQRTIEDMDRTIAVNGLLRYYIKEKQWGMSLWALAVFMKNTGQLGKPLTQPTLGLNAVADSVSATIESEQDSLIDAESYGVLSGTIASFITQIKRKAAADVDTASMVATAAAIKSEVANLRGKVSTLHKILAPLQQGLAGEVGLGVVQAVSGIVSFMEEQGLDGLLSDLKDGNFASFFSADTAKATLEAVAKKAVGDLLKCCADNEDDSDAKTRLMNMNRIMSRFQRGKEIYDRNTGAYALNYIRTTAKKSLPDLERLKGDVSRVSRAKCMNQGQTLPGRGTSVGLTLI